MNPVELVHELQTGKPTFYSDLYKNYYKSIEYYILNNSGTQNDAEDIFQDAMLVLLDKLNRDDFRLTATLKTYLFAICKNLWFKRLRNPMHKYEVALDEEMSDSLYEEYSSAIEEETNAIDQVSVLMSKVTHHCNQLLNAMFFEQKNIDQVKEEFGYTTKHNAQNQKYKCIEQMRKMKSKEIN
ncbi:MAG: sigma-70 family RNA polymerase sigma factor [Bacteroidetes bacterium]|nr:sigma-70 family RNA polymerase sigma factor [Bacteroidota bacterium]